MNEIWRQDFNPLGNQILSTIAAAIPVCSLFFFLAVRRAPAWRAALYAFVAAAAVALAVFHMPPVKVVGAVADGLVFGWFRIGWIVIASVFVYDVSVESGQFEIIKKSIGGISADRRLQVLLIAFAFGALLEGAGGGGAPVAVCAAMLIGLGFPPLQTAVICLIGNSVPVAYAALGNPVRTLVAVTGLPEADFSAMLGRILPIVVLALPFWLVRMLAKTRDTVSIWFGLLVCGVAFGGIQFFWSNYMGAALASIMAGIGTLLVMALLLKVWQPAHIWRFPGDPPVKAAETLGFKVVFKAWSPFILLMASVVIWGLKPVTTALDKVSWNGPVPGLHGLVYRMPPVVPEPTPGHPLKPEDAKFDFSWLSGPGTGVVLAGFLAGPLVGLSLRKTWRVFRQCVWKLRLSLVAIMAMLGVGYLTRYCGMDATLGMAMARSGKLFPFFGTMIGWLGVALSGTDAGSNALFGSFQQITANKLGLSPVLMGAANSAGGVMGKMITAQSLVIACAVTRQEGQEGTLFRKLIAHSLVLACLIGLLVMMYAYVFPGAIPSGHKFL